MRAGSFKPWCAATLLFAAGACSKLIGVSDYQIDPSLDEGAGGSRASNGGQGAGQPSSMTDGGEPAASASGTGGTGQSGTDAGGETMGGSAALGGAPAAGGASDAGGEPPVSSGCHEAADCDDTIDCTVDSCGAGQCSHTPTTTRCDASNCESCQAGIGCVAGPKSTTQLLVDGNFDDTTSGWKIDPTTDSAAHVVTNPVALSSPKLAQLGPAAADATEYLYGDLYQNVSMPAGLVQVSLTYSYRFTPGAKNTADEYVVAALYRKGATDPTTQFHELEGTDPAQTTWKAVTYNAPQDELAAMGGKQFTFDLVAHSFDGVYLFDNVRLEATACQPP